MTAVAAALEAYGRSPELATRAALALPALVATWTGQPAAECTAMLERALTACRMASGRRSSGRLISDG